MGEADFSGYATKAGLKCSDGRTITPEAFKHMNGKTVPLVWQHGHNSPENVLGHVLLEGRSDGVYCHGFFNKSPQGRTSKELVTHGDITSLSIYANQLVEKTGQVLHGMIREVSLVLSGANPGALIDFVQIQHSAADDDIQTLEDEAVIYTGLPIKHDGVQSTEENEESDVDENDNEDEEAEDEEGEEEGEVEHSASDPTLQEVFDSLSDQQKTAVQFMLGKALALQESAQHSENTTEGDLTHQEGTTVTRNVFEQNAAKPGEGKALSHADAVTILTNARKPGYTLRTALNEFAQSNSLAHGINDIELLFPDAKSVQDRPEWDTRRMAWVAGVINGTQHTPFSRIKTRSADLTLDEARAKGYVKGALKKEQFFGLMQRTTGPSTVYKKQKLDRDDILDVTDFDIVAWLWTEMRFMLEEELATAVLIGDGRDPSDPDKIKDPVGATEGTGIRSIAYDDDLYAASLYVNLSDANSSYIEFLDEVITSRRFYKGTGQPTFYTTELILGKLLTLRNADGARMFRSLDELKTELRVDDIVAVETLERVPNLIGIMVNLADYAIGTDKGGEITKFDDFDIDYNQFKYLIETRLSGALTKIRSALVYWKTSSGAALVVPATPTQDDDEVTIVDTTGVTYKVTDFTGAVTYNSSPVTLNLTVTSAHPIVIPTGGSVTVTATPSSGSYYFENNVEDEWTFTNPA